MLYAIFANMSFLPGNKYIFFPSWVRDIHINQPQIVFATRPVTGTQQGGGANQLSIYG